MSNETDPVVVANKLSFKYDSLFDSLYDKRNHLDSQIKTNQELIQIYNEDNYKRDIQNESLKSLLLAFFIILLIVLFYKLKFYDSVMVMLILSASVIVLTMLYIYFTYYMYDYDKYLERISKQTQDKLLDENAPIDTNALSCDSEFEGTVGDVYSNSIKSDPSASARLLKPDSNYDVWSQGDHKSQVSEENNIEYRYIDSNGASDIKGSFNKLSPDGVTYYDCKYTGSNPNGLPFEDKYQSAIPCKYYIGYDETARYVKYNGTLQKVDKDGNKI